MDNACGRNDLVERKISWVLWRVPLVAFVVGTFLQPLPRMLLWTPALLLAGGACVINATNCGRIHCFITGPLYLLAATLTVLGALEVVSVPWALIAFGVPAGTIIAYAAEQVLGKYRTAS
jgi:hypothetical protein